MLLYLDESGGAHSGSGGPFLVTGLAAPPGAAKAVVKRFRRAKGWEGELKGSEMASPLQEFLLRGMMKEEGFVGAAFVAHAAMPRLASLVSTIGEPRLYASMVSDLLVCPTFHAVDIEHVIADTGRYSAPTMRGLPQEILDCTAPRGFHRHVEFKHSHQDPGLQLVDVLSNHLYRRLRMNLESLDETEMPESQPYVPVYPASLEHPSVPDWVRSLPSHPGAPRFFVI